MAFAKMVTAMCDQCFITAPSSGQTRALALRAAKLHGWKMVNNGSGQYNYLMCHDCLNDGLHPSIRVN